MGETGASLALIPVWDFCNHAACGETDTSIEVDGEGTVSLQCTSLRSFSPGDEVRIDSVRYYF